MERNKWYSLDGPEVRAICAHCAVCEEDRINYLNDGFEEALVGGILNSFHLIEFRTRMDAVGTHYQEPEGRD